MTPGKRSAIVELGGGIGAGLVRVSEAWLPKGKLAIPQPCVVPGCTAGPFSSTPSIRQHVGLMHPGKLDDRELTFALDRARRAAVQQAMNWVPRSR
jgi:hypothetical protein